MILTRREFLTTAVAVSGGVVAEKQTGLGVASYSYHRRLALERPDFRDPLVFLEHCHRLGAGGIQMALGVRDSAYLTRLRKQADAYHMFLEGEVRLPRDAEDVERFTAEVRTAREAGIRLLRTVLLPGRRYETFDSLAAFREWEGRAWQALTLAEPVLARHGMRLAFENHKDYRSDELIAVLKRLGSQHIGVLVDTGNNVALLEEPHETVAALAPWAFGVHLKDMAVAEYADGFLLAEVPYGQGFLDLPRVVSVLKKAQPGIRFNVEMITRDPLKVPCLTEKYWATLPTVPGRDLARMLALVRRRTPQQPLPNVSALAQEQLLAAEEENVRKCLAYARQHLPILP